MALHYSAALRSLGCSASLRSLSYYLQLRLHSSRQLPVSGTALSLFLPSLASFHHVRSHTHCYIAGRPGSQHTLPSNRDAQPFRRHRYYTHWVSLRSLSHPFTSVQCSPPAAHNFCVPCGLPQLRACHVFCSRPHSLR